MIDCFPKECKPIRHRWDYSVEANPPRSVVFDITLDRFDVLQDIRQTHSDFEGGEVGLGFAITALIMCGSQAGRAAKEAGRTRRGAPLADGLVPSGKRTSE